MAKLEALKTTRDSYFDISSHDGIDIIMRDSTKSMKDREEDAEFLRCLHRYDYAAFGTLDVRRLNRFRRAAKRHLVTLLGRATIRKLDLHVDYLTGRSVVFALASNRVNDKANDAMADALRAIPSSHIDVGKPIFICS